MTNRNLRLPMHLVASDVLFQHWPHTRLSLDSFLSNKFNIISLRMNHHSISSRHRSSVTSSMRSLLTDNKTIDRPKQIASQQNISIVKESLRMSCVRLRFNKLKLKTVTRGNFIRLVISRIVRLIVIFNISSEESLSWNTFLFSDTEENRSWLGQCWFCGHPSSCRRIVGQSIWSARTEPSICVSHCWSTRSAMREHVFSVMYCKSTRLNRICSRQAFIWFVHFTQTLTTLDLTGNRISSIGAKCLADALKINRVRRYLFGRSDSWLLTSLFTGTRLTRPWIQSDAWWRSSGHQWCTED